MAREKVEQEAVPVSEVLKDALGRADKAVGRMSKGLRAAAFVGLIVGITTTSQAKEGAIVSSVTPPAEGKETSLEVSATQISPTPEITRSSELTQELILGEQFFGYRVRLQEEKIETLQEIVSKFNAQGTTIEMIREINGLENDQLLENQALIIPILGVRGPEIKNPSEELLIVTLGDSNLLTDTNQDGNPDPHFPNYMEMSLEKAIPGLNVKTIVLGEPGGDIKKLEDYLWWVEKQQPDILILQCGNNEIKNGDYWRGSPTPFEHILSQDVKRLTEKGIKIILVSPFSGQRREDRNYDPAKVPEVIKILDRVAGEINEKRGEPVVLVVDAYHNMDPKDYIIGARELPGEKNPDYVHLNDEGQRRVAERVVEAFLEKAGWIKAE